MLSNFIIEILGSYENPTLQYAVTKQDVILQHAKRKKKQNPSPKKKSYGTKEKARARPRNVPKNL
jgi:hypothetical protein